MVAPRPRPGVLELTPYVPDKSEAAGATPLARLASNEGPLGPSPRAVAAYREAAGELHRYPDGGATALRQAIARRHGLDPELVVCGAGSDELIALLIRAYAGPGDEVLHSSHGFVMYPISALAAGARPVAAPERDLRVDVDALLAHVTPRTRLVFVANPGNPTGSYVSRSELERLRGGLPDDVILAVDAAYAEYVTAPDYASGLELARATGNTVMLRTFSKLHGLAALRLGWLAAAPEIADTVNRVRGPFNVAAPAQAAGIAAMEDLDHQERARRHNATWLAWLTREISALGLRVHPSVANFVLIEFPAEPGRDAAAAAAFLAAEGVVLRRTGGYGLPRCLRASVGLEEENRRLVTALSAFLSGVAAPQRPGAPSLRPAAA